MLCNEKTCRNPTKFPRKKREEKPTGNRFSKKKNGVKPTMKIKVILSYASARFPVLESIF